MKYFEGGYLDELREITKDHHLTVHELVWFNVIMQEIAEDATYYRWNELHHILNFLEFTSRISPREKQDLDNLAKRIENSQHEERGRMVLA